jgi:hypothetical protein
VNPLREYFEANSGRLIHKWIHYFDIYHRHFEAFRGKPLTLVEFGVFHGGSLQMWKHYFGAQARIVGVDINPACASLTEDQVEIRIGDQGDRSFLRSLRDELGEIDILIDDGAHMMRHQVATFEELFPAVRDGGVYLVEDLHTGYWPEYGGGHERLLPLRYRSCWPVSGLARPTNLITDTLTEVLTANGLIFAFALVGILVWASYWLSGKLTRGRIHGSAIAITIGLALAWIGGSVTGGTRGLADFSLLAGIGVMGGGMFRDFAIVATAFGASLNAALTIDRCPENASRGHAHL